MIRENERAAPERDVHHIQAFNETGEKENSTGLLTSSGGKVDHLTCKRVECRAERFKAGTGTSSIKLFSSVGHASIYCPPRC